jgi:hypothetical protein
MHATFTLMSTIYEVKINLFLSISIRANTINSSVPVIKYMFFKE